MMEKVKISEMVEEVRPMMVEFVVSLGYTQEQAEKFSEGYIEKAMTYPILQKMEALTSMDDCCMSSGFDRAGIDEAEALERTVDE